jgi:hypothetical protein
MTTMASAAIFDRRARRLGGEDLRAVLGAT